MIETELIDNVAVVRVRVPRLDAGIGLTIKETIAGLLQDHKRFVIDLSDVKLVDSGGLGGLVATLKAVVVQDGRLSLVGLQRPVKTMMALSRMDRQFELFEDLPAGVSALA